jgi:HK97 family phage portal protein
VSLKDSIKGLIVFRRFIGEGRRRRREVTPTATTLTDGGVVITTGDDNVKRVAGPRQAMALSTVYRCVCHIADSVASLRLRVMVRRNGIFVESDEHLNYLLSVAPSPWMNAVDFWRGAVQQILLSGNAYILPRWGETGVQELVLLSPGSVAHDIYRNIYTVTDMVNHISEVVPEDRIIHLMNLSFDGRDGVSVVEMARETLEISATAERETKNRFANGGMPKGFITNEVSNGVTGYGEYQDEQLDKLARQAYYDFRSSSILALPGAARFQSMGMSSADLQFLQSRQFTVREICRFFGVHPSYVYDDTSSNYKTSEAANVAFLTNRLNPMLKAIELELTRKLFTESAAKTRRFLFDRSELMACDLDSRVTYQKKRLEAGLSTVNELRQSENLAPVKGGDEIVVSANLKTLSGLTAEGVKE